MLLSLLDELRKRQKKIFFWELPTPFHLLWLEFADIKVSKRNFLKSHPNK